MRRLRWLAAAMLLVAGAAGAAEFKPWTGGPAPSLELQDLRGRTHRLADYRGKVVVLAFWATWCEPCREEMPALQRLGETLANRPFAVLAVNLAEPLSRIERFLEVVPVTYPLLRDRDESSARAWGLRFLPTAYVLGKDGAVRWVVSGEHDWNGAATRARLAELLD
jgi:thiol-disulfide isomerase/thioredoxin